MKILSYSFTQFGLANVQNSYLILKIVDRQNNFAKEGNKTSSQRRTPKTRIKYLLLIIANRNFQFKLLKSFQIYIYQTIINQLMKTIFN